MNIEIRTRDDTVDAEALNFARCCIGFELGNFRDGIESVRLILGVAEAEPAGNRYRCRVEVEHRGSEVLSAEASDMDWHVAIHLACERAGWSLACRAQPEPGRANRLPLSGGHDEPDRAA